MDVDRSPSTGPTNEVNDTPPSEFTQSPGIDTSRRRKSSGVKKVISSDEQSFAEPVLSKEDSGRLFYASVMSFERQLGGEQ